MSDLGLGKIITTEQQRDAIHVAVAPVTAAEKLYPGQVIGFTGEGDKVSAGSACPLGIVDPFLASPVFDGQRFWMFLFPNTVTGMRHEWQHPAFGGPQAPAPVDDKAAAEKWLRDFADTVDLGFQTVIESAAEFLQTGKRFIQRDSESAEDEMYNDETRIEFWRNYGIYTGTGHSAETGNPFCCTC